MTLSEKLTRTIVRASRRFLPFGLLALASHAQAGWTLVRADTPVTVIHAASAYQAEAGQRLAQDDIVANPDGVVVQIQDEGGNIVALGHDTRVMLTRDAHVALLRGWVKVQHACTVANCPTPVVETERTRFTPADQSALVIAATPPGYDSADAVFCESGSAHVLLLGTSRGKPLDTRLEAHQFALRAKANDTLPVSASPDPAFVATMPLTFRDALRPLPMPSPPSPLSATLPPHEKPHDPPTPPSHPVAYGEVSEWLVSALAVRTDPATRFTDRFHVRLSDPAFRLAVKQHIRELPDWRPLVFPPPPVSPRLTSRNPVFKPVPAYSSFLIRP